MRRFTIPFHELAVLQEHTQRARMHFCSRPLNAVSNAMEFDDLADARAFIREGIAELHDQDFAHALIMQPSGDEADVYGWEFEPKRGWYIKFAFSNADTRFEVVSFHPPEEDLETQVTTLTPWESE